MQNKFQGEALIQQQPFVKQLVRPLLSTKECSLWYFGRMSTGKSKGMDFKRDGRKLGTLPISRKA